jgi:DNA topoisomerase-6 subunit B
MSSRNRIRSAPSQAGLFESRMEAGSAPRGAGSSGDARPARSEKPARAASKSPAPAARRSRRTRRREDAQSMAARQREISVSEFFTKNRHLLGFDNPQKALLTTIKEAVDNSLDACEEAGILPTIGVTIEEIGENRFRVTVEDNGPGIVRKQVPKIFGKLLYGSKFHRLKQQRGQQGIGISAAGMYAQLTTGQPVEVLSRTGRRQSAHRFLIALDTQKNQPVIQRDEEVEWDVDHGTMVTLEMEATYKKGRRSVDDYIAQTALANPHAELTFHAPKSEPLHYPRVTEDLPEESKEIQPHPYGVELGRLIQIMRESKQRTGKGTLTTEFSRVSGNVAEQICDVAGVRPEASPRRLATAQVELLFRAIPKVRIMAPPTSCLSPIGEELLQRGLEARIQAELCTTVTRPPAVYRGNPFQVEVGIAWGGRLETDEDQLIDLYRFANRVPLQYQQSACAVTKSVVAVDWKKYGLQQSRGAMPSGPVVLMVHLASVWVPFTSESKEAIASYPEIVKEIRLALMEAGRRLGTFLRARRRAADAARKKAYIEKYLPHIGDALRDILGHSATKRDQTVSKLKEILERARTP